MDYNLHNPSLYKWKRQTPQPSSRVYSRSQNCKTSNDIETWMKKVEQASDRATETVFGTSHFAGRERGRYAALQTREQVHEHDQVLTEAQEVLSKWMQEKVHLDENDENDEETMWHGPVEAEVRQEWDHLLDNTEWGLELTPGSKFSVPDSDPFAVPHHSDEEDAVGAVLSNMMQKKVIQDDFLHDLRLDGEKDKKDPRIKMELRHKQVKENREKRERELERKRRQQQEKKDSLHKAKQIVIKEERERDMEKRREEKEIRKEMIRIRKNMQEERKREQEQWDREMRERIAQEQAANEKIARQAEEERNCQVRKQQIEEEQKRRQVNKLKHFQIKQSANNLKCLQRHFSAWYQIVLERHLQMGKARALADWKILLRAWNAWRTYNQRRRLDVEAKHYKELVVSMHRKQQQAEYHHRCTLLRHYLASWQNYVRGQQDRRNLEEEQNTTRSKMLALLDAAATGKLWSQTAEEKVGVKEKSERDTDISEPDLDSFFHQPRTDHSASKQNGPLSSKSDSSLTSSRSDQSQPRRVPTEAWQVTRQHVKLTNEEIASLGGGDLESNAQHSDTKIRKRFGKQPWMNTHYVINNFENRYTAQQKLLHSQQKQIQEQKQMIEELQFFQNQRQHQENIARQQLIQYHLSQHGLSPQQQSVDVHQLNNLSSISNTEAVVKRENNNVSQERCTNVTMKTARTDSSEQTTDRSSVSSVRTQRTSTSTAAANTKYLQVLRNMEERAQERKRQKAEREAKRKEEEKERLAMLEAQEAEMKRQMEEEKKKRVTAYKEKKKLEKQREIERNHQLGRLKELMELADVHYTKSVMKFRGLVPLQKLVALSRQYKQQAEQHHSYHIMRLVMLAWHRHTASVIQEKNKLAEEMNSFLAVKRCFARWKLYKHHLRIEMEKARRHHEKNLLHKVLQAWADVAAEEKCAAWERERVAKEHYLWSLKKRTFCAWRRLPDEIKLAAEREKRRNDMRKRVAHLLPDFEGCVKTSTELL